MVSVRNSVALFSLAGATLPNPEKLQATLQEIAQAKSDKYNCTISIAVRDADSSLQVAAGIADVSTGKRAKTTDSYPWGSGTKPLTGASILKLASEGKFKLDDKAAPLVDPYLKKLAAIYPEYGFASMADLWGENATNVTVMSLLNMQAGIPDFDTANCHHGGACVDPLRAALYKNPSHDYTPMELMNFSWVRGKWDYRPFYSSTNFMILGMILAEQTGAKDWTTLDQAAFLPAEMRDEFRWALKGAPIDYSPVHGRDRTTFNINGTNDIDTTAVHGCFAGWTASDVEATPKAMADLTWAVYGPEPSIAPMEYAKLMHNDGSGKHHYGVATFNMNSKTGQVNSSYGISYGHLGATYGFNSLVMFLPALNVSLAVATNMETDRQTHTGEAACFAYNAIAGEILGQNITCTAPAPEELSASWGKTCNCTQIVPPSEPRSVLV
jgi:D-alanyl-D-alanine carboxypeptidase